MMQNVADVFSRKRKVLISVVLGPRIGPIYGANSVKQVVEISEAHVLFSHIKTCKRGVGASMIRDCHLGKFP